MAIFVRDQNRVSFLFESGTYAAPSGVSGNWIGLVTAHTPTENENVIEVRYANTSSRNFGQLINGPQDYEGTISYHPQDFRMFGFALGSVQTISGTNSTHFISELNSDGLYAFASGNAQLTKFPSFTIIDSKRAAGVADGNHFIRDFNGAVIDTLTMTATQGEPITCELTYKAQGFILGSAIADIANIADEDTTRPYIWSDVTFAIPSGTVMTELNEIAWTIENNVENRHYVNGSRVAQAMVPTMRNHTLELTLDSNSTWFKTFSDFHKNGSVFNALMVLNQSATENMFVSFSGCKITELQTPSEMEGIDEVSVTVRPRSVSMVGSDATLRYNPYNPF